MRIGAEILFLLAGFISKTAKYFLFMVTFFAFHNLSHTFPVLFVSQLF